MTNKPNLNMRKRFYEQSETSDQRPRIAEEERLYNWLKMKELEGIREKMLKETKLGNIIELDRQYNEVYEMGYEK